jgi:hypothetical protein
VVTGYLSMLPTRKNSAAIDQRFIEYVLAITDGVALSAGSLTDSAAPRSTHLTLVSGKSGEGQSCGSGP